MPTLRDWYLHADQCCFSRISKDPHWTCLYPSSRKKWRWPVQSIYRVILDISIPGELAAFHVERGPSLRHYASGNLVMYTIACRRYADVLVHRLLTCLVEWEGLKQPTERHDEGQACQMVKSGAVPTERRSQINEEQSREGKNDKDKRQQRRKRADSTEEEQNGTQGCSEEETSDEEGETEKDGEAEEMSEEVKAFREHVMQVCGTAVSSRDTPVSSLVLVKTLRDRVWSLYILHLYRDVCRTLYDSNVVPCISGYSDVCEFR